MLLGTVCAAGWKLVRGLLLGTVCVVNVHLAVAAIMAEVLPTTLPHVAVQAHTSVTVTSNSRWLLIQLCQTTVALSLTL
jgi:hypothetical protein